MYYVRAAKSKDQYETLTPRFEHAKYVADLYAQLHAGDGVVATTPGGDAVYAVAAYCDYARKGCCACEKLARA